MADRLKELEARAVEVEAALPKLREKSRATAEGPAREAVDAEVRKLEEELAALGEEISDLRASQGKVKVRTSLRLPHAPKGRSNAGLDLRGAYVQLELKDGVPVLANAEVSDADLRAAGFVE